ncbi:FUSC family protein [Enterococcus faecalis]|uniref:FUSC family protein n=1 Tax=Enterococcus faecalis TaxID=1351 RepID=UPI0039A60903
MKNSTFLKDLFAIDKANDELFRLVGVAICMAIPLLIGYFSNNLLIGTFGSMGIYTFIYYQPLPLPQLLRRLNIVGFFIVLGNSLGMLSHHVPWLIPITIAIVAFLARLLFRLYGIEKPGALLVIMSTAMGTSNNFPLHKIPIMASFVLLGVVTGIIMGIVLHFIDKRPYVFQKRMSLQERLYIDPASLLDALHYAAILFLAAYLSQSLHLVNAYWMTFTCAAILQGENLHSVMQRNVQRILGTSLGLLLSAILLMIPFTPLQTIGIISILYAAFEGFTNRNYAIASFFITPMSLLLSNLARQQVISNLLNYRLVGIVLGSLLGFAGAYVFTTALRFYNRAYSIDETFENQQEERGVL